MEYVTVQETLTMRNAFFLVKLVSQEDLLLGMKALHGREAETIALQCQQRQNVCPTYTECP